MKNNSQWQYIADKESWYKIEEDLGDVSELSTEQEGIMSVVKYKCNGVDKKIFLNGHNFKLLIQCFLYCTQEFTSATYQSPKNK